MNHGTTDSSPNDLALKSPNFTSSNSHSVAQEIQNSPQNPKHQICFQKSLLLVPNLSQLNPTDILTSFLDTVITFIAMAQTSGQKFFVQFLFLMRANARI